MRKLALFAALASATLVAGSASANAWVIYCPPGYHIGIYGKFCWPNWAGCRPGYHLDYNGHFCVHN